MSQIKSKFQLLSNDIKGFGNDVVEKPFPTQLGVLVCLIPNEGDQTGREQLRTPLHTTYACNSRVFWISRQAGWDALG